jgi:aquaporin Z
MIADSSGGEPQAGHLGTLLGMTNAEIRRFDFEDDSHEWRRLFSETFGTFLLVLAAVGPPMVNARFGGHAISPATMATSPGLTIVAVVLFMGTVSGAHLNPAVTLAFAMRGAFPWRRVPGYLLADAVGAVLGTLMVVALAGRHGAAGTTLPGPGVASWTALITEMVLTAGLVSVVLGTASGAQAVGPLAALAVGSYIILAGLWTGPLSGASMNPWRSLAPALVTGTWRSWWIYLVGPLLGSGLAVPIAWVLRGTADPASARAAQGTLGGLWRPER